MGAPLIVIIQINARIGGIIIRDQVSVLFMAPLR